jgi:bifunctional non-homologous end joining protein LigD
VRKLQGGDVDAFAFRPRPAPAARVHQAMSAVLAATVPTGDGWIHQLKHDGFRIIGHKDGDHVRLWSRNGRDWSVEFVAITAAVMALPFARIVIDGEAWRIAREALLGRSGAATACLYAFDLLHVGRDDLRRESELGHASV